MKLDGSFAGDVRPAILNLCLLPEAYKNELHECRAIPLILKMLNLRGVVVRVMLKSDNGSEGQEDEGMFRGVLTSRRKMIGKLVTRLGTLIARLWQNERVVLY